MPSWSTSGVSLSLDLAYDWLRERGTKGFQLSGQVRNDWAIANRVSEAFDLGPEIEVERSLPFPVQALLLVQVVE